jgi:hypothetical protein
MFGGRLGDDLCCRQLSNGLSFAGDGIYAVTMIPVVVDTNVLVFGLRSDGGASRQVPRLAIGGPYVPLFSNALWLEYEDVLARPIWTEETTAEVTGRCWQPLRQRDDGSTSTTEGDPTCVTPATTSWLSWRSQALRGLLSLTTCATCVAAR